MDNLVLLTLTGFLGIFATGVLAQSGYGGGSPASYGAGQGSSYGSASASSGGYGGGGGSGYTYGQGSGVYFKKPVPIDEKPIFFRTPYWLPNMYYGHYGYPWTEWFDGGPRYVVPIMNAYPRGGGGTQSYNTGYGAANVGSSGYAGGSQAASASSSSSYGGQSGYGAGTYDTMASTTPDPYNDGFSYYKGIPIYQTYYEKYLLQKSQAATTAAPA